MPGNRKSSADSKAVELRNQHFKEGTLNRISYARPAKIFTANQSIIQKKVGRLNNSKKVDQRDKENPG